MAQPRPRPALFRALGSRDPPLEIVVGACSFRLVRVLKHDSWAATALYADATDVHIIVKFNREEPVFGLPMRWAGRWLGRRESQFLRALSDLQPVPDDLGPVTVDGTIARNAVARTFVDGAPLRKFEAVRDDFFLCLEEIVTAMHDRGMAYVDLHKKANIIVDCDGRPHLVDFQVSFRRPGGWLGNTWLFRMVLAQLAALDRFHIVKHIADCRPDLMDPEVLRRARTPPRLVQAHRAFARPLQTLRRRLLVAIGIRGESGLAETEVEPEEAVRLDRE